MKNSHKFDKLNAFRKWLWSYSDQRRFKYYEGNLAHDRWLNWQLEAPEVNETVDTLANEAWQAHISGLVALTQQRLPDGTFAYWAEKREGTL